MADKDKPAESKPASEKPKPSSSTKTVTLPTYTAGEGVSIDPTSQDGVMSISMRDYAEIVKTLAYHGRVLSNMEKALESARPTPETRALRRAWIQAFQDARDEN